MFGFLALGFFTAMALKNNGNGGNGGGLFAGILASLVSIKGIKETLAELGWGKKKKEEEEENTSSSSDGIEESWRSSASVSVICQTPSFE